MLVFALTYFKANFYLKHNESGLPKNVYDFLMNPKCMLNPEEEIKKLRNEIMKRKHLTLLIDFGVYVLLWLIQQYLMPK